MGKTEHQGGGHPRQRSPGGPADLGNLTCADPTPLDASSIALPAGASGFTVRVKADPGPKWHRRSISSAPSRSSCRRCACYKR